MKVQANSRGERVCAAVGKPVIVAGSIDRAERIAAVVAGRAAGFTVGTAALDGAFPTSSRTGLAAQLRAIEVMLAQAVQSSANHARD